MNRVSSWLKNIDKGGAPIAVVLSRKGHDQLIEQGAEQTRAAISEFLGQDDWIIAQPQPWPRANQEFPRAWSMQQTDQALDLLAWAGADLHWLEGHFPDQPIVPGVALLHWVGHLGHRCFDRPLGCHSLQRIKFQTPIQPETLLRFELSHSPEKQQLSFRISSDGRLHASGTLR